MGGVMMRGTDRMAIAMRVPDGRIHIKTQPIKPIGSWAKIPIVRGVVSFFSSMVIGMKTLIYSADVLEAYSMDEEGEEAAEEVKPGKLESWLVKHFGEKAVWNLMIYVSVLIAIAVSVLTFVLFPTVVVNLLGKVTKNHILLNLAEGLLRILMFIGYILLISKMEDIRVTFQYHGSEHKTIHCFENGLELTPENAQSFYTLHPRCGTSFLMFVMVISLILFSMLGWPNLLMRILSRIVLIPVVAGLSYEVLKWAGRSDGTLVKMMSMPGILLQKLTTKEPTNEQLEVAIASMKAVLVPKDTPYIEGICDKDANLIEERHIEREGNKE